MGTLLSNPYLIGTLTTVIAAGVVAVVSKYGTKMARRKSLIALYQRALKRLETHDGLVFTKEELAALAGAIKDPAVKEVIDTETLGPVDEREKICAFLQTHAPLGRLAQQSFCQDVVDLWLFEEHVLEGRNSAFSSRSDRRSKDIEKLRPKRDATVIEQASQTNAIATSSTQAHQNGELTLSVSAFFKPLALMKGMANACKGRVVEIHHLLDSFALPENHLIVIGGFGGIGKTTLVSCFAVEIADRYQVLWIDCATAAATAERVLNELARYVQPVGENFLQEVVGKRTISEEEKINALIEFVSEISDQSRSDDRARISKPLTLIFDDYHLVTDQSLHHLISRIASAQVNIKIILITRNRNQFSQEILKLLNILKIVDLDGLSLADCRDVISAHSQRFPQLANLDNETMELIWSRTGEGIPAAINILISLTINRGLKDVLKELPDYDPFVAASSRQWLDELWSELPSNSQQMLKEISALRRPAERATLLAICQQPEGDRILDDLVGRFIVTFDSELYSLHALWHEYVQKTLTPYEIKGYHLRAALLFRDKTAPGLYQMVTTRLESCYHYIKAEVVDDATAVLIPISDMLQYWGFYQELLEIIDDLEKDAKRKGRSLDPRIRIAQIAALSNRGEAESSIAILKDIIETSQGEIKINALQKLGWISIEIGDRSLATDLFQQSLDHAISLDLTELEGEAYRGLEHIAYFESRYQQAWEYDEERLRIYQKMGNTPKALDGIAWVYHDFGAIYRERGVYEQALEMYEKDFDLWHQRGDPPFQVGWLHYDIGQILYQQGKWTEAQERYQTALRIFQKELFISGIAHVEIELGRNGCHLISSEDNAKLVLAAIEKLRRIKNISGMAYGWHALGEIYLLEHNPDLSLEYLQQGLPAETDLKNVKGQARCLHWMALAYEQQGERAQAEGKSKLALERQNEALATIRQAQDLYASIGVVPSFRHVHDDEQRISTAVARVAASS